MKNILNIRSFFVLVFSVCFLSTGYAQKVKKNKVRLKAQYVKIMDGEIYFDIKASSKVKKQNITVAGIDLTIYNVLDDDKIKIGKITTNAKGKGKFVLDNLNQLKPDSTNTYNIKISFKGNDTFKKASKSISFKNADIKANLIVKDSINYVTATLVDTATGSPITDQQVDIQIERLFKPLKIGEEFNNTDESGTVIASIDESIPGVNGNLTIEVVLNDSNEYGTVKALVNAPIGKHIVDESTFDQRTMWSPRNKTPLFILIFPNILIFGIWGIIIYLFINLFKITKS